MANTLGIQATALKTALTTHSPKAFIFRIKRGSEWDKEMFVLPVVENGQERTLVFEAEFKVNAADKLVTYNDGSADNLLEKENGQFELKNDGVRYFMRLMFHINEWKNKVV